MASPAEIKELLDRGTGKRSAFVEVRGGTAADAVRIPLAVVAGKRPGPTAWINASLHGDEYLGPTSAAALLRTLDPAQIRGRVILTPTLNPGALRSMQREDSARPADWNRIWAHGPSRSDVPAAVAWAEDELLARADVVVDLHSGGNHFLQAPFAVYSRAGGAIDARSAALAKACGLPWIWAHRRSMLEGALITAAARQGTPAALIEIGGEGKAEPEDVRRMLDAARGALAYAGIVSGRPRFLRTYQVFTGFTVLRNRMEGRWSRLVDPGAKVRRGQPLGRVLDLLDHSLEVVKSPATAMVAGICTYGFVPSGDYVAELAHHVRTETARK